MCVDRIGVVALVDCAYGSCKMLPQVAYWDGRHDDGLALTIFKRFNASSCTVTVDPLPDFNGTIRCISVPGFGMTNVWSVTVSGRTSEPYRLSNDSSLSYARPSIATFDGPGAVSALSYGNQTVRILGTQFGRAEDNAVSLVTYGPDNKYIASNCRVVVSHTEIQCETIPGVGAQLRWSVSVGNLSSETPTTSYAVPSITNVTGPGADQANTEGSQQVFIEGQNFGTVRESLVDSVTYTSMNNPTLLLTAENCSVVVDHVLVRCLTSPGFGYDLQWTISIGGQASAKSSVVTSYGLPMAHNVTLLASAGSVAKLDTEGGSLLRILGNNFGRAGDAVVMFAGKQSATTVYVSHQELQVRRVAVV
jgi:hypothetical protein